MSAGRCACGAVAYRLTDTPLFVHACHCTWCQRETGAAFALNALIERARIELTIGRPEPVMIPSASGKGQEIFRCPDCQVALWSHYGTLRRRLAFLRVGTLDEPASCPPDIHIFTSTKLPWMRLPEGVPAMAEYYRRSTYWPAGHVARYRALQGHNP